MILSHKIQLSPSKNQVKQLTCAVGVQRFTYNWALTEWQKQYKEGLKPSAFKLKVQFNAIKKEKFPWVCESPRDANATAFFKLQNAFQNFFNKRAKYPKYKKKGRSKDSFAVANDKFRILDKTIKLPVIGLVKMTESLRFDGKIMSGSVSRQADKWFVSISVEVDEYKKQRNSDGVVGLDLGLNTAVMTSDGNKFCSPKPLKSALVRLKRRSKRYSRKKKGSANRRKSALKLARLHMRVSNIRKDWQHKVTTKICSENQAIGLEDLAVANLLRNHKLARAISDIGWGELRRQIEYKALIYGDTVQIFDRFYPSSKTCCICGVVKDQLLLSDRVFECECGNKIDRDLNAAINLKPDTLGLRGSYASGHESSGCEGNLATKLSWLKEELDGKNNFHVVLPER